MSVATSSTEPALEIPSLYMISNSATRNGGAILFLITLTRARLPMMFAEASLMTVVLRMSIRIDA